jgi:hypothetical protein
MSLDGGSVTGKIPNTLVARYYHHKDRAQSDAPNQAMNFHNLNQPLQPDGHIVSSADIYSWKLKKEYDGTVYAVFCIHVSLKSGFKWIVERRYSQFRDLRKEINRVRPDLKNIPFPKKNWLWNLSKAALKSRQELLNAYMSEMVAITPQLLEIGKKPQKLFHFILISFFCSNLFRSRNKTLQ